MMSVFNRAARNTQLLYGNEGTSSPEEIEVDCLKK